MDACWRWRWKQRLTTCRARSTCTNARGGRAPARWCWRRGPRGVDNHLVSPLAAMKRDALIWLRQQVSPDRGGRGLTWIPAYDPGLPSVLVT